MKSKLCYILSTIILTGLIFFGTYTITNISADINDNPVIAKQQTETETQIKYEYQPLNITDSRLAYYSSKSSELSDEHLSEKPKYELYNESNKIASFSVKLTKDNISWGVDTENNTNDTAFTVRYLTGKNFAQSDKNRDAILLTDYAYKTAFRPCKDIICDYITKTGNPVYYCVNLQYDNDDDKITCPKWINIRAYTPSDDGQTFDFSFYIFNYDKDRIADRTIGEWDTTQKG